MMLSFSIGVLIGFMFGFSLMACMKIEKEKAPTARKCDKEQTGKEYLNGKIQ